MRHIILILVATFLCACAGENSNKKVQKQVSQVNNSKTFASKIEEYCEPCGGVKAAFIHKHGAIAKCIEDGGGFEMQWNEPPKELVIGKCK